MTREQLFVFMKRKYPLLNEKRLKQGISELPNEITISEVFDFMKQKYPLLEEKRLKRVISELPKEVTMSDRYISTKEFRKLNMVTELLTERFIRNQIKWYCEDDGWSLLIDAKDQLISVFISEDDVNNKSVMDILLLIIGAA